MRPLCSASFHSELRAARMDVGKDDAVIARRFREVFVDRAEQHVAMRQSRAGISEPGVSFLAGRWRVAAQLRVIQRRRADVTPRRARAGSRGPCRGSRPVHCRPTAGPPAARMANPKSPDHPIKMNKARDENPGPCFFASARIPRSREFIPKNAAGSQKVAKTAKNQAKRRGAPEKILRRNQVRFAHPLRSLRASVKSSA